jgi:cyclopropane-fatty-acyl-phospholipid synthase
MEPERRESTSTLHDLAVELEVIGANVTMTSPSGDSIRVGPRPDTARVHFHTDEAVAGIARRDHLMLAESHLRGGIDVSGDWLEVMKVSELIMPDPSWPERVLSTLRAAMKSRRRLHQQSIHFHYHRPPDFFLGWFERWRSYSHGFYDSVDDSAESAQARKLQFAIDALGLKPGSHVFDMGCGWGAFIEFAGRQGIRVHGITISREQHRFVRELIREQGLPCTVEYVDFLDYRPSRRFDGAVFMGTLEHFSDYRHAMSFASRFLTREARIYADFCCARGAHRVGAFLGKYIWPGSASYVDVPRLLREVERAGFGVYVLEEDTLSYACTVRDWADGLERSQKILAERYGTENVRAFILYLRASQYYFAHGKTQAYHLVAGRASARLDRPWARSATATTTTHVPAKRSPTRP